MRKTTPRLLALSAPVCLAAALGWGSSVSASSGAQDAVLLARLMVGEAGWSAPREHAALAWTLRRRANTMGRRHGWTWRRTFDAYTRSAYSGRPHSSRHRWVGALALSAERPDAFPGHLPWSPYAERWERVLRRARAFIAGRLPDPCSGPTEHWGAGWVPSRPTLREVDCGSTRNRFYATAAR
jgi:hypothetical protein